MDVSKEQKTLKVFATIDLVFGILAIIGSILAIVGLIAVANGSEQMIASGQATADEVGQAGAGIIIGIVATLFSAVLCLIDWKLLKNVATDATKYKPAWIITIASVVLGAFGLITNLFGGADFQTILNDVVSVGLNGYILMLINKVKNSVTA